MKKLLLVLAGILTLVACSQPKDIYFNGSEGSHSGLKYDKAFRFFESIPNSYSPEELKIDLFCNYIPKGEWNESEYVKGAKPIFDFLTHKDNDE